MIISEQKKQIGFKLVYYGAALSGKTTSVRYISDNIGSGSEMLTLETRGARTLFFDMLHVKMGKIGDYDVYFNIYTTPGQTVYITSRRLVLTGADAIVFVMDSQQTRIRDNMQSWFTMERQLLELDISRHQVPLAIQMNKRDMPYVATPERLLESIKAPNAKYFETNASTGEGIFPTLSWIVEALIAKTLQHFQKDNQLSEQGA